jgi:hypothetical protein
MLTVYIKQFIIKWLRLILPLHNQTGLSNGPTIQNPDFLDQISYGG